MDNILPHSRQALGSPGAGLVGLPPAVGAPGYFRLRQCLSLVLGQGLHLGQNGGLLYSTHALANLTP